MLKMAVELYEQELGGTDITLLPPKMVFNDWRRKPPSCVFKSDHFNATECIRHYKDTNYVMSFWTHNWQQEGEQPIEGAMEGGMEGTMEAQQQEDGGDVQVLQVGRMVEEEAVVGPAMMGGD